MDLLFALFPRRDFSGMLEYLEQNSQNIPKKELGFNKVLFGLSMKLN